MSQPVFTLEQTEPAPTLRLQAGELGCLHGSSGAGKSRLLRAIADLDPNQLQLRWNGRKREEFDITQWRQTLQYLPAEPAWWTETAAETIGPTQQKLATEIGLTAALLNQPVKQLSTGERQRCALLRALSVEPSVLLLDEPTAALDPQATEQVETLLRHWLSQERRAIVWVSHDAEQRQRLGDQQWLIENGVLQCP